MIDEKTEFWYIISGRYGDLAWLMLEDMAGKKFSHRKASKHLVHIMNNWPDEEVCRTMKTWLNHSDLDPRKINTFITNQFREKYYEYVANNGPFKEWSKPTET
jgi:hypothetical protein